SAVDLRGRVPLLGRGRLIGLEDRLDDGLEGPEDGCRPRLGQRVRLGLGVLQGLADGIPPDPKLLGDLPRAQAVTMGLANPGEVVHGAHPDPLRPARPIAEVVLPWTWIRCRSGPELDADHQGTKEENTRRKTLNSSCVLFLCALCVFVVILLILWAQ